MTASTAEGSAPAMEMIGVTVGSLQDTSLLVLEGIDWSVKAGEYWAIGGLQASGKSDLMATAAGIMPPMRGAYRVFGKELGTGYEHEHLATRLRLGLVFDGGRLFHHLTVAENIALPIRYHQDRPLTDAGERVQALLELAALDYWADKTPGEMRRNWQQRVGLARALALKPEVLLLDSPLTGLDPRDAFWWLNLLDQLAAGHPIVDGRPMTIVITGDDLRPWRERARQFAILKNRQFIPLGNRSELGRQDEALLHELHGSPAAKADLAG